MDPTGRSLDCDHVEPHRGDEARFWAGPFQTLCKSCHGGEKQREERRGASDPSEAAERGPDTPSLEDFFPDGR